jgi:hypothetical protein
MGSPGIDNGVFVCWPSKTLVAQCDIGARAADELLVQVPLELFDKVGDIGVHDSGGSGAGGNIVLFESSDQTGDMFEEDDGKV